MLQKISTHPCASLILVVLSLSLFTTLPVYAQTPPDGPRPDSACRICHSSNQQELTLPSGETLMLQVPVAALNHSPHSPDNQIVCTDCHRPSSHYQYPHQPLSAQSRQEFRSTIEDRCQTCHYPHSPLHSTEQPDPDFPDCIDCHGSHQIDQADHVLNSMPAACITCHTDQTADWAAKLIAPRPGIGQPAEGYAGSERCRGCHDEKYFSWRNTLHANMIQDPAADPEAVVGDFNEIDPDRTFELNDVAYTIGSRWKQQYITQNENGDFHILPAQWNVATGEWVAYNADSWQQNDWRQSCGSCHVTGLNTESWGFVEFGIGCESCHGPGEEHANDPRHVKPFAQVDDQVCGSCHSRGTSPDGYDFPATYHPGDTLTDHFAFTTDKNDVWPDGSAKKNHQQYMDWKFVGSPMALSGQANCITCHSAHDDGTGQAQLLMPLNDLCLQCHTDKKAIIDHVPFHDKASAKHDFTCPDCHMPKMASSAVPNDIHNHIFTEPNPQASIDHGGLDVMMNACNTCHTRYSESPQWAADTIAYVKTVATPGSKAVFGPGPTPTSPPPPTPIPSVGQPVTAQVHVETGLWIRNTALILMVVAMAAALYWGVMLWIYPQHPEND